MTEALVTCTICGTRNRDREGKAGKDGMAVTCGNCGSVIVGVGTQEARFSANGWTFAARIAALSSISGIALLSVQHYIAQEQSRQQAATRLEPAAVALAAPTAPAAVPSPPTARPTSPPIGTAPTAVQPATPLRNGPEKSATQPQRQAASETPALSPQPFPAGIRLARQTDPMAPFALTTPDDGHLYYAKLVDLRTNQTAAHIFMRGGERREFDVPLGTFELRYASGTTWYGEKDLFGPQTVRSKADRLMEFRVEGDTVTGRQVRLIKQAGGNLSTSRVGADQF